MVGVDKNKLPKKKSLKDVFKKEPEKEVKKTTLPKKMEMKQTGTKKTTKTAADPAKMKAFKESRAAAEAKQALKLMHSKTHQDLINAVYKVADELKVEGGPWPMLRAAEWGHFTDDRGKLYDGPVIDDIDGFTPEQKKALKKVLGV